MNYSRLNPRVDRKWLMIISGTMWTCVGIFLDILAYGWLKSFNITLVILSVIIGIMIAWAIAYLGLRNLANKNVSRILAYPKKVCIFAFQEWKSYILIVIMMSLGIYIRTTGLFPKIILTQMYIGIGTALFFASFKYYKNLI